MSNFNLDFIDSFHHPFVFFFSLFLSLTGYHPTSCSFPGTGSSAQPSRQTCQKQYCIFLLDSLHAPEVEKSTKKNLHPEGACTHVV